MYKTTTYAAGRHVAGWPVAECCPRQRYILNRLRGVRAENQLGRYLYADGNYLKLHRNERCLAEPALGGNWGAIQDEAVRIESDRMNSESIFE